MTCNAGSPWGAPWEGLGSVLEPGDHGSTFGGNALTTAAGAAAAKVLVEENIPSLANETGAYFQGKLKALSEKHGFISEVRGMGLLIAIEMSKEISGTIVSAALQKGLLINAVRPNMIRFMPPLNVSKGEIDEAVEILDQIFTESDN